MNRKGEAYLVLKAKGYSALTARVTAKHPSLKSGEIAIKLNLSVPEGLFKKPQIQATISIPESVSPANITAEVLDNVEKILSKETGLSVSVDFVTNSETF